jgi:hypothetical protein
MCTRVGLSFIIIIIIIIIIQRTRRMTEAIIMN